MAAWVQVQMAWLQEMLENLPRDDETPSWRGAVWPWLIVPCITQLSVLASALVLRLLHCALASSSLSYRQALLNYIGMGFNSNPRRPQFMVLLGIGQLVASLLEVAVFALDASRMVKPGPFVFLLERCLGIYLSIHQFFLLMKDEFVFKQPFYGLVNIVDMLTIPQMVFSIRNGWLSLGFLRSHRALRTFERMQFLSALGVINFLNGTSDLTQRIMSTVLRFLALIVVYAGIVFVIELLGDLDVFEETVSHTSMGDISFFTVVYWVLETVTTVGYGDYTPKSVLSRCVTMLCMISGVVIVAVESTTAAEIWTARARGTGAFKSASSNGHVVVMGGCVQHTDESLLIAFFTELYHKVYKDRWPECVVLVCTSEAVQRMHSFIQAHVNKEAVNLVTVLQGSPLLKQDLDRCECASANDVYIMSDTSGRSTLTAAEEDKQNILRALSVRRRCPKAPVWVVLLTSEAKAVALDSGIRGQRCFAIDELRDCLFSQSCHCRGWSTLLCNLAVTTDTAEVEEILQARDLEHHSDCDGWRADYVHGMDFEIYGFLPSDRFCGKSFGELVQTAYQEENIIVLAAQVDGKVIIAPFKELQVITKRTVLFALAQDEQGIVKFRLRATGSNEWRSIFSENTHARETEGEAERSRTHFYMESKAAHRQRKTLRCRPPVVHDSSEWELPPFDRQLARSQVRHFPSSLSSSVGPGRLSLSDRMSINDPMNRMTVDDKWVMAQEHYKYKLHQEITLQTLLQRLEHRAETIRANSEQAPFITFIEMSTSWRQISRFVMESRGSALPNKTPIIVMCPAAPTDLVILELSVADDEMIGMIVGSSQWVPDLVRAGIREAAFIVCPAPDRAAAPNGNALPNHEDLMMVDAEGVMLYQMLDGLGVTARAMTLFEFKHTHNINLLSQGRAHSAQRGSIAASRVSRRSTGLGGRSAAARPLAGCAAIPGRASQVGSEYHDPRTCALVLDSTEELPTSSWAARAAASCREALLQRLRDFRACLALDDEGVQRASFGATICGDPKVIAGQVFTPVSIGSMLARVSQNPGILQVMQALAVPEDRIDMFIWQIRATRSREGLSYAECWHDLMRCPDGPALALGLYRLLTLEEAEAEEDPPAGYVMTNPRQEVLLRREDLIYVIAPAAWGQRMHEEGLLLNSKQEHDARLSEVALLQAQWESDVDDDSGGVST